MVDGTLYEFYLVTTGVLQGDVLAYPCLSCLSTTWWGKQLRKSSLAESHTLVDQHDQGDSQQYLDLDFADDIALLESSMRNGQAQLSRTSTEAEDLDLVIRVPKTEYMTVTVTLNHHWRFTGNQ